MRKKTGNKKASLSSLANSFKLSDNIGRETVREMARAIGMPGCTSIYDVANAYAKYRREDGVFKSNKEAKIYLKAVRDSGFRVTRVPRFGSKVYDSKTQPII